MNIAFIHNSKKLHTGANYINNSIAEGLRDNGVKVNEFYPKRELLEHPTSLKGLANILFFYSLLENKRKILRNDIIQGTTYTPITFLAFKKPIISHFGSTTYGFLKSTPKTHNLHDETKHIMYRLKHDHVISEVNIQTRRPLRDIAEIEQYVAQRVKKVIATSKIVQSELINQQVNPNNIIVIHNAIEDLWFSQTPIVSQQTHLVFLGRLGNDAFLWKLKGFDRLIDVYLTFPDIPKLSYFMTTNEKIPPWIQKNTHYHTAHFNLLKSEIVTNLKNYFGSIFLLTSRYEGFSLSLIEAMSQGIVPVAYPVGVAPEIITDNYNGFIVKTHSEMISRIRELLSNSKKRLFMAENCKITAQNFRVISLIHKLTDVYTSILNEK